MIKIGHHQLDNNLVLSPMAGITDLPFRKLCRTLGAGLTVSEMVSSKPELRNTRKSQWRHRFDGETGPISVQIAGTNPQIMAEAAQYNVKNGAQIIDINMGCPAKKVCNVAAGSALMQNVPLVKDILEAVVDAVNVPVTLKMRTGWNHDHKNAPEIAQIAQQAGIQSLAVHGRTRADAYKGQAEYDTIALVKQSVDIPVFANGDVTSPEKAKLVLKKTGADGLLIGRAAQGNPWIFREILHFLTYNKHLARPSIEEFTQVMANHLKAMHEFYGDVMGVRIARKHIGWYSAHLTHGEAFRKTFVRLPTCEDQVNHLNEYVDALITGNPLAA